MDEISKEEKDYANYPIPQFYYFDSLEVRERILYANFLQTLTCAKNAVIVGDSLQLPNVITDEDKMKLDTIFDDYIVLQGYNCAEYSFLQSVCAVIPNVEQTLLREHYHR